MKRLLLVFSIITFLFSLSPKVEAQGNQIVTNGGTVSAVNFPGAGCTYNWVNDTPGIGLAASGTGDIASFTAVNNGNSPVTATITATPVRTGYVYIANANDGTVSVINSVTNLLVSVINVGRYPGGVSASNDGTRLYVVNGYPYSVSVINTATNAVIATIPINGSIETGISVSPDGSRVYVANSSSTTSGIVSVINTTTNSVIATIGVGNNPSGVAISPDGKKVYVTNSSDGTVSVINTLTNTVVATILLPQILSGVTVSPDGSRLYVVNDYQNNVAVINTVNNAVIATIPVGRQPVELAISPDGSKAYVTNERDNTVSVINTISNTVIFTIPVDQYPGGISISPDGNQVYVENYDSNNVSVINTANDQVVSTILAGSSPGSIGNFISAGPGCNGTPVKFTITVTPANAAPPTITDSAVTGIISACTGGASASPQIQQFTVSGSNLTSDITATAPTGFEISLAAGSGYGNSVTIPQTAGTAGNTVVYARSAASAATGVISGNVTLTSAGASNQTVAVSGTVNALPTVNAVANQIVNNGAATTAVNFTGTGNTFTWTNDTPGIGLAASGTGDIASFAAVNTGSSPVKATITATPILAGFAYVANYGSDNVSVINTVNNTVVATIEVGKNPQTLSLSPDGSRAYVINYTSNNVSVINTLTNSVIASIPVGNFPYGIYASSDNSKLYVLNGAPGNVCVINTATYAIESTITVGVNPYVVLVSSDSKTVYVSNYSSNSVSVINASTNQVTATITVGNSPYGLALSPDGSLLYVVNSNSGFISVINTTTNKTISTIQVGDINLLGITVSPDGSKLFVTGQIVNDVLVINTATNEIMATIPVGSFPAGIAMTPDGSWIYVVNESANNVSVINALTNTVVSTIPVGAGPWNVGNFISNGIGCMGPPIKFTITVNPTPSLPPTIMATTATGTITACAGTASVSPQIEQFTVSGSNLTGNITATAPAGFELSLTVGSGYGNSVTIPQNGGTTANTAVYVRSAASDPTGNISGNVTLTSAGAVNQTIAVAGVVNALPTVNAVADQTVNNGTPTTAVNFTGTGSIFSWTNDTPGIGLPSSGAGDIPVFTAVNTGSSPVTATVTVTPHPAGFAYITSNTTNNISVINTATNAIVATIPVGSGAEGVSVSRDGSKVYIANNGSNTVSVISTSTNTVIATIPVGSLPSAASESSDGSKLFVANIFDNTVSVISTATNKVTATISGFNQPYFLIASPTGNFLYVENSPLGTVSVVNTATNTIVQTIKVGQDPIQLTISSDGGRVYSTNEMDNTVSVINTATNAVVATIPVDSHPYGETLSPDGAFLYVGCSFAGAIDVIDTKTNTVIKTVRGVGFPVGVSATADGKYVYVVNDSSPGTVSMISTATNSIVATIPVDSYPYSIGNFIAPGPGCSGISGKFTITVKPATSVITASTATGTISACAGTASASPQIQQFTVSGSGLTTDIIAAAPTGFEVSLAAGSGYGNSVTVSQIAGTAVSKVVYVRSSASASTGSISGSVTLTSAGASNQTVAVSGVINALPMINAVTDQIVNNGMPTTAVNFSGTGDTFNWVNDTPGIGLAAGGTGDIASFVAINTGSSPVIATVTATPVSIGYAYIANSISNDVSVINTETNTVIATIPVGQNPTSVAVSPDGTRVYVTNQRSNTVSVINPGSNSVVSTIAIADFGPNAAALSPDGKLLYVVNLNSNNIVVINTTTDALIATIGVGGYPVAVAVSPDGSRVYVTNSSNSVSVIDATTNLVKTTIPVGRSPFGIAVSADGSKVFVAISGANNVSVIDAATGTIVANIPVGSGPAGVSMSPGGGLVYVANGNSNNVSVINTSTYQVVATVPAGSNPTGISVSPDGSEVYAANQNSANVSIINTQTNTVAATVDVGKYPVSLGNFIVGGTGCNGIPVKFTITVNPATALTATITASGSPSPLNTIYGTASTATVFNVSGANMTAGILVTPPPGFELSTNDISYSKTITIGAAGTIASTPVYIRLASSTPVGNYPGNIVLSSAGAPNVNVVMPLSTVTPAPLTITADNKSKTFGQANPVLTITYTGFVNNDGPAQLTTQPAIATAAITTSAVGQYPITVTGATSLNYTITQVPGVLTINPVPQNIIIPNAFTPNGDGINDTWYIKNLNSYLNCTVQIYNRYGENVYSSIGYGIPWDGTYKGAALPTGTYYYIINLNNDSKVLSGFVVIIR